MPARKMTGRLLEPGINPGPAAAILGVVVTLTVAVPEAAWLKSTVYGFKASPLFTEQLAFGALVVQERYTRPLPDAELKLIVDVPVLPAVTLMAEPLIVGPATALGE